MNLYAVAARNRAHSSTVQAGTKEAAYGMGESCLRSWWICPVVAWRYGDKGLNVVSCV